MGLSVMIFIALRSLYIIPRMILRKNPPDEEGNPVPMGDKPMVLRKLLLVELAFGLAAWAGVIVWVVQLIGKR